jgi:hypothetical protein
LTKVGKPSPLFAPAQHDLDDSVRTSLLRGSAFNILHLDGRDREASPREQLAKWRQEGALTGDREAGIYLYEQSFTVAGSRTSRSGFFCVTELPERSNAVAPTHEIDGDHRRRQLEMLTSAGAAIDWVTALYEDPEDRIGDLLQTLRSPFPTLAVTDQDGVEHRLFYVPYSRDVEAICRLLQDQDLYIGDGEVLYRAALAYRDTERRAGGSGEPHPSDFVLTFLTSAESPELELRPFHRIISGLPALRFNKALRRLDDAFTTRPVASLARPGDIVQTLAELAPLGPAFAIIAGGSIRRRSGIYASLTHEDALGRLSRMGIHSALSCLDGFVFDQLVLPQALDLTRESLEDCVRTQFEIEPFRAMKLGRAKESQLAILMPPPLLADLKAVSRAGAPIPTWTAQLWPRPLRGLTVFDLESF